MILEDDIERTLIFCGKSILNLLIFDIQIEMYQTVIVKIGIQFECLFTHRERSKIGVLEEHGILHKGVGVIPSPDSG